MFLFQKHILNTLEIFQKIKLEKYSSSLPQPNFIILKFKDSVFVSVLEGFEIKKTVFRI